MKTLSYAEYSARLHRPRHGRRIPRNGTLEVTRRCPLVCAHCYNNLPMGDREAQARELSLDEYCRLLDEIAAAGCVWLLFTGGEIFARPDFLDIYRHAKRRGFVVTLFTNATMITPAIVAELREYRPFSIEVTLYGHTAATYEALTGVPGSHARCRRGVELLRAAGLPLKLKTVAVSLNKHEVVDMRAYAEGELGLPFKMDAMLNPRIDCSQSPLEVRLTPEEVVWFDLEDERRKADWLDFASVYHTAPPPSGELYSCGGGLGSFAIDPYGKLRLCVLSHEDSFDLRQGSFAEGWNGFLDRVRKKPAKQITKCTACHLRSMCGMCPANGELHNGNGDAETPVDFLCETAHLRAHAFGLPVPAHGACEYCAGGARHQAVLDAAARLREPGPGQALGIVPGRRRLPVLREPAAAGGCGSCGEH